MSESWRDLMRPVGEVEPSIDLLSRIHQREAEQPVGRPRGMRLPRLTGWVLAGVGCLLVLGVLAVAAHSRGNTPPAPAASTVSAAKLAVLRASFARNQFFRRSATVADASATVQFGLIRPQSTLASDANLDSIWASKTREAALMWKSGVSETISRWACRCDPASSLKKMARTLPPFRYLTIGGSPAVVAPSAPGKRDIIGIETEAQARYGEPASVEVVRDGLNITLYQYGPHVLPGLIAAAQQLVGTAVCDGCPIPPPST